jgi:hypothetical protein
MRIQMFLFPAVLFLAFCTQDPNGASSAHRSGIPAPSFPAGARIAERFPPPPGFSRIAFEPGTFSRYLRDLPLEPEGTAVHLFDGSLKHRQDVHAAVVAMSVGRKDLQQCADAVMRLRAEFLFATERQDRIAFHFTNGFLASWDRWRAGDRISVKGDRCSWVSGAKADASHDELLRYLDRVFTYAGTRSLEKELIAPGTGHFTAGDVFIHGGSPGHAMLVVDIARHADGRQAFLLAQSYMPAQQIHVVKNLRHPELGSWFVQEDDDRLYTPEWTFDWVDRKAWPSEDPAP